MNNQNNIDSLSFFNFQSGDLIRIELKASFENGLILNKCKEIEIQGNNINSIVSMPVGKLKKYQGNSQDYKIKIYKLN